MRSNLTQTVLRAMQHRGLWSTVMRPVAWLYATLAARRRQQALAAQKPLPVPVIVVGNVVLGGTGKTPIVAAVVDHLKATGWVPAVISRGYGGGVRADQLPLSVNSVTPTDLCGDEPKWLHEVTGCPVVVHPDRVRAAAYCLSQFPNVDVLVSDDGLQHLALPRALELVVFDERGDGNGLQIPAGCLREPWINRPIRQPVLGVYNRLSVDSGRPLPNGLSNRVPFYDCERRIMGDFMRADGLEVKSRLSGSVQVITAIAKPDVFWTMLQQRAHADGFVVEALHSWPDHSPLNRLKLPPTDRLQVVCTGKDAVKLREHPSIDLTRCWVAPLTVSLADSFWSAFDEALHAKNERTDL